MRPRLLCPGLIRSHVFAQVASASLGDLELAGLRADRALELREALSAALFAHAQLLALRLESLASEGRVVTLAAKLAGLLAPLVEGAAEVVPLAAEAVVLEQLGLKGLAEARVDRRRALAPGAALGLELIEDTGGLGGGGLGFGHGLGAQLLGADEGSPELGDAIFEGRAALHLELRGGPRLLEFSVQPCG